MYCISSNRSRNGMIAVVGLVMALPNCGVAQDDAFSEAKRLSQAFEQIAERVIPSVVVVETVGGDDGNPEQPPRELPEEMKKFFGDADPSKLLTGRKPTAGSGIIFAYSEDTRSCVVVTAASVIAGAEEITITTYDQKQYVSSEVAIDKPTDLAIVRLNGVDPLQPASLGNSDNARQGQLLMAIGHHFGMQNSVTLGMLSGTRRIVSSVPRAYLFQSDATINPGSSGGPLVDLDGNVIAVNLALASHGGNWSGVGLSLPINHAKHVVNELIKHGRMRRGQLGIAMAELNREESEKLGVLPYSGILVKTVLENSSAAAAGIQAGDILLKFGDVRLKAPMDLVVLLDATDAGSQNSVTVMRSGEQRDVTIHLKETNSAAP